jgi:hypothetical protein
MPKSVITKFEVNEEISGLEVTRYDVEIRGAKVHGLKVERVQDLHVGGYRITVEAPDGVLPLSTMDALARRVDASATVRVNGKLSGPGFVRHHRSYGIKK